MAVPLRGGVWGSAGSRGTVVAPDNEDDTEEAAAAADSASSSATTHCLQMGQESLVLSHSSTHSAWKACLQGRIRTRSPSAYSS